MSLGASDHVTNYLLVSVLQEMRAEHPLVVPSVQSGTPHEIIAGIGTNALEFGLFFTRVPAPGNFVRSSENGADGRRLSSAVQKRNRGRR